MRLTFYFFLLFFTIACSKEKNKVIVTKANIVTFELFDNSTDYQSKNLFYYEKDSIEYLFNYNKNRNYIEIYDFKSGKLKDTIDVNLDFYIKNNKAFGFYVHNFDSIFVLESHTNRIHLTNIKGTPVHNWIIHRTHTENQQYELTSRSRNRMLFYNGVLYVNSYPFISHPSLQKENENFIKYPYKTFSEAEIEFKDTTFTIIRNKGEYPVIYKDHYYHGTGMMVSKTVNNKGHLVFSFPADHNLYVYNKTNLVKSIPVKSKYLDEFKEYKFKDNNSIPEITKYAAEFGKYENIMYDKYRDLYYRVVLHNQSYVNDDQTVNHFLDKPWSIMVLDSNFNILDEVYFPPKKFYFFDILITRNGLLISNNHELNENLNPNKFSFTLYKIQNED